MKWEYHVIAKPDLGDFIDLLNRLGEEGWEAIFRNVHDWRVSLRREFGTRNSRQQGPKAATVGSRYETRQIKLGCASKVDCTERDQQLPHDRPPLPAALVRRRVGHLLYRDR